MAFGASASVSVPGVVLVAVPLEETRFSQLEPLTRLAFQFTVEFGSPRLRTSTISCSRGSAAFDGLEQYACGVHTEDGAAGCDKQRYGNLIVPAEEETRMASL